MLEMQRLFEKVFVINLEFKTERLARFCKQFPRCLSDVVVWKAVHGDSTIVPSWWSAGRGAYGCYRSHMAILEYCINEQVESYLVFEDDAIFVENFEEELSAFLNAVPEDWQQIYLGGQLFHEIKNPPKRINKYCLTPYNVNRTHAFAVHRRGYQALVDHLYQLPFAKHEHIDHHLGRLHESGGFAVYVPNRWMVGQGQDWSNISGRHNNDLYWPDPENCVFEHDLFQKPMCVFLESSIELARKLHDMGWHMGYWLNKSGLDRGVCEAMGHFYPEVKLTEWHDWTRKEVIRDKKIIPCLYHPALTWEKVQKLEFATWIHIQASTVDEAVSALENALYVK